MNENIDDAINNKKEQRNIKDVRLLLFISSLLWTTLDRKARSMMDKLLNEHSRGSKPTINNKNDDDH